MSNKAINEKLERSLDMMSDRINSAFLIGGNCRMHANMAGQLDGVNKIDEASKLLQQAARLIRQAQHEAEIDAE